MRKLTRVRSPQFLYYCLLKAYSISFSMQPAYQTSPISNHHHQPLPDCLTPFIVILINTPIKGRTFTLIDSASLY